MDSSLFMLETPIIARDYTALSKYNIIYYSYIDCMRRTHIIAARDIALLPIGAPILAFFLSEKK